MRLSSFVPLAVCATLLAACAPAGAPPASSSASLSASASAASPGSAPASAQPSRASASAAPSASLPVSDPPLPGSLPSAAPTPPVNRAHVNMPSQDATVGIGAPVIITFAHPVPAADRALVAARTRVLADGTPVAGGWWWASKREAHFRPYRFWPAHARVSFTVDLAGASLGDYRGATRPLDLSFSTTAAWRGVVDGKRQRLYVYKDGRKVRTVLVSTGAPDKPTRNGIKLIIDKDTNYTMRGQDENGPYAIPVAHAMRLTWSGEFIHSAPWATYRLGRFGGSHGCTGTSNADAAWLYEHLPMYTPVKYVRLTGGPTDPLNGLGDWNVPSADLVPIPVPAATVVPGADPGAVPPVPSDSLPLS